MDISLRPYQKECVDIIDNLDKGSHLVSLPTGCGKTVIFSQIKRKGRVLILSHRDELVHQPEKYYDCSFGIEQAGEHSNGEEVVSASVPSMIRRLDKFQPDDFDTIITDEAHHAVAPSYQRIYDYFKPRLHLGFTATPNRQDKQGLGKIFEDIIYHKNIKWAIDNQYLTNINCLRVNVGYDLSHVKKRVGDFDTAELSATIDTLQYNRIVAYAYQKYASGQTMIFASNVKHAEHIAELIDGAVVVTGKTQDRADIIDRFTRREIPCIVNCMVFTEGTDLPLIETIIVARPTANESLYRQIVGRGLRLYPGKKYLTLIDCVGVTGKLKICTAPTLLGLDPEIVPKKKQMQIKGMLTDMPDLIDDLCDGPAVWIENAKNIDLFAEEEDIQMGNVNWLLRPDGSLFCNVGNNIGIFISQTNDIGKCNVLIKDHDQTRCIRSNLIPQNAVNFSEDYLNTCYSGSRSIWNKKEISRWGNDPASKKQMSFIRTLMRKNETYSLNDIPKNLTKQNASIIIDHLLNV